jgi:diguanylate cyclase (GGDEF)-like protein/PAS domain S-box-containing protein
MAALLRKKRVVWAVALCFAVLVLGFSWFTGRRYLRALEWVEHTHAVNLTLERVLSDLRDEESAMRGFALTGDHLFLSDRETNPRMLERDLGALRALVADNPSQTERANELTTLAREKLGFVERVITARAIGAVAEVDELVASKRGVQLMDRVRVAVVGMRDAEQRLLERRRSDAAQSQLETIAAVGALALVLVVLLVGSFVNMQRDAVELRQAAAELAESEERYRVLVDNVSDLVTIHDKDGELSYISPSVESLLGYAKEEGKTISPFSLLHPEDVAAARYNLANFQAGEARNGVVTCRLRRKDGEYRWFEFKVARVDDASSQFRHVQAVGRDVTVRRQLEQRLAVQAEELRNLSLRDGLTGLYNRRGFLELSQQVVRVAEREQHRLAVLFVDLDGLKLINDELGHGHGDRAILEAADLLRSTCRATDLVARLGGDEFVVLAANVNDESVEILKGRLERALAQANAEAHRDYRLSFSLGVAAFDPAAPVAMEKLLVEADSRMYEAKAQRQSRRSRPPVELHNVA